MLTKLFNFIHRWFYPKTTQEVFNIVIDNGYYGTGASHRSDFMCIALSSAYTNKVITKDELAKATDEIDDYLNGVLLLRSYLRDRDLPHSFNDRLAIYRDWANRP